MSFGWLASTVGARFRPGIRRRMAPLAQRDLASEIDADALAVERVWAARLVCDPAGDGQPTPTVIALVEPSWHADVTAWLDSTDSDDEQPTVCTDWLLFPAVPEAVLIGVVERAEQHGGPFRFNLRLSADRYRRQLSRLIGAGRLGLTTRPLQLGPKRELMSPCRFVPVQMRPLRDFLRELPAPPVV